MKPTELIDKIFKDPSIKYELTEFESPAIDFNSALEVIEKPGTGKQTGKTIYYLKPWHLFIQKKKKCRYILKMVNLIQRKLYANYGFIN